MSKVMAFIQARCSSSRFPNKVLAPLLDVSMIEFMVLRVQQSSRIAGVVVVTSSDPSDDALVALLESASIPVHRGDLDDVLARFGSAAARFPADTYVRLTGDCPMVDPALIDRVIDGLEADHADYASNVDPPTFPDGLDVEAFKSSALAAALRQAKLPSEREHVTLWMRSEEAAFKRWNLLAPCDMSAIRLTVDYPDDLTVVRSLVAKMTSPVHADLYDCLRVLGRHRDLLDSNRHARNEGLILSMKNDIANRNTP